MKQIDFTKPGGFPLTQNQLGYMQTAYQEVLTALAAIGGNSSTPFIVSGMEISNPTAGTYSATSGWLMYNNELIKFNASSVTGASGPSAPYVVITPSATSLTFNDGSTPNVIMDVSCSLQVLPTGTLGDAVRFPLAVLRKFGTGLGATNRDVVWSVLTVSTPAADGGVTGTVFYKKDYTANTLHIRGTLTANNAQNFAASPGSLFYLMGTLPTTHAPANTVYFTANYFIASSIQDSLGVGWVRNINCGLNGTGQFFSNWIKPEVGVPAYGVNFNTIIPLD